MAASKTKKKLYALSYEEGGEAYIYDSLQAVKEAIADDYDPRYNDEETMKNDVRVYELSGEMRIKSIYEPPLVIEFTDPT